MHRSHVASEFDNYVEHPRFGRGPRYTDVSAERPDDPNAYTASWRSTRETRVLGTAVAADLSQQTLATLPVLFYFDERRTCADCSRRFLFFAEEQKYWFEELGFNLNADCIRCWPCRHVRQNIEAAQARYEELARLDFPSCQEQVELLDVGLKLCEQDIFGRKVLQRFRTIANQLWPQDSGCAERAEFEARLASIRAQ